MMRSFITAIQSFAMLGAVELIESGYSITGYVIAMAIVFFAWMEGHEGWGSRSQ